MSPEVDVITSYADWVGEESGKVIVARRYDQQEFDNAPLESTIRNPIGVISAICRRDTVLKVSGFDETLRCWEDGDLFVRLAADGARFAVVPEVLATSLRHDRGISNDETLIVESRFRILQNYLENLEPGILPVIQSELEASAKEFLRLGLRKQAGDVVRLCLVHGGTPPTTNNKMLQCCKKFIPPFWLLEAQQYFRRWKQE